MQSQVKKPGAKIFIGILIIVFIFIGLIVFISAIADNDMPIDRWIMKHFREQRYYDTFIKTSNYQANSEITETLNANNFQDVDLKAPYLLIRCRNYSENAQNNWFNYLHLSIQEKNYNAIKTIVLAYDNGGENISQYYSGSGKLYKRDTVIFYFDVETNKIIAYEILTNTQVLPKTLTGDLLIPADRIKNIVNSRFLKERD